MELTRTEVLRYLNLVKEKRYLFIVLSLLIMSVIVWGSYFIPKKYKASSTIFIERNVIEDLVQGIAITPSMDARIKVLRDTMLSRSIILDVLRKLDLDPEAENAKELETMIISFQKRTNIVVRKSSLVNVTYVNEDPELARNYVNSLVNQYVEKNIFAKREEAYDATEFIKGQTDYFKGKIDEEEREIIKFRKDQGIYVTMDERSFIDEIKTYGKELERIMIDKNELISVQGSIEKQLSGEEPYTVTMYTKKGLKDTIKTLEHNLRLLMMKYTEQYPDVVRLKAEIEALKIEQHSETSKGEIESEISAINPIHQELRQKLMETEASIKAFTAKEVHLKSLIREKKEYLADVPENRKMLADMLQKRNSYVDIYGKLLERLGQSEVAKQMEVENKSTTFRIIEPAVLPTLPVSPPRKAMILFGILFGFIGSLGVIVIMDQMDYSIKTVDALKTLGLPILAIIPRIPGPEDIVKVSRKDILVFSFASLYVLCLIGVFTLEVLGITYVDQFISNVLLNKIYNIYG